MRRFSSVLIATLVAAGCTAEFQDGRQVEGVWVSNRSWSVEECDSRSFCERLVGVATAQLASRVPSAVIREARFHDMPHERFDGSIIAVTHPTYRIVFELSDGSERAEQFGCDIHGGLMGGVGNPAYAEFCPGPADGG